MNEQDKEHARLLASLFAMNGLLAHGGVKLATPETIADASVEYGDAVLEALEPNETVGLPPIKRRTKKSD
jgi:hypothetical protein